MDIEILSFLPDTTGNQLVLGHVQISIDSRVKVWLGVRKGRVGPYIRFPAFLYADQWIKTIEYPDEKDFEKIINQKAIECLKARGDIR